MPAASDIRIDIEGTWYYRGIEMTRRDIVELFYRHLSQDESGYFIELRHLRYPVEVEDTAYVVRAVHRGGDRKEVSGIHLLLSDGSSELLDPGTLRISATDIPYCRVKNRRFEARLSRSGFYQLAEYIRHDTARDEFFIPLKGRNYYIRRDGQV